jgi:hypothetical protein
MMLRVSTIGRREVKGTVTTVSTTERWPHNAQGLFSKESLGHTTPRWHFYSWQRFGKGNLDSYGIRRGLS